MATKATSHSNKFSTPLGVKWDLRENEDGKLEWYGETKSGTITSDSKDKKKRPKAGATISMKRGPDARAPSNMTNRPRAGNVHGNRHGSPSRQKRHAPKHEFVMLDDIKAVAYDQLSEVAPVAPDFDRIIFKAQPFNEFLYQLLYYFDCFFKKKELELKGECSTSIEPGQSERKAYADSFARVEVARKKLGRSYCHLILGLGLEDAHHMGCGSKRVSDTHRDRGVYETMYTHCCFVVWITFRRKTFDVIKKEMGTILRSDTFNPAIRVKNAPVNEEDEKTDVKNPKKKISPAQYRRIHPKRPAIKSIIHQRSPVIVSILPSSREEAGHLFAHSRPLSPSSLYASAAATLENDMELTTLIEELENVDLAIENRTIRIGILHDSMEHYNPMSLQGGGQEEAADKDEQTEENKAETTDTIKPPDAGLPLTRQGTAVSHATTEAPSEI